MRRIAFVLIALVIALAGCGSDDDAGTTGSAADSSPTTTASDSEDASALEGTWETDPITVADMANTLREAQLGEHVGKFEQNAPISDAPTSLILEIRGDWDLSGQTQGGKTTNIDYDAEYESGG